MKRGVALIIVVGVLAIIVILAVAFATSMLLQQHEAAAFLNSTKAQYIAEAGVNRALADFRKEVTTRSYNDLLTNYIGPYAATSGTNVSFGDGTYTLIIQTEETKVNINTFDENDTTQINILRNPPLNLLPQEVANIIDYRDYDSDSSTISGSTGLENGTCKNAPYNSLEEVKAAFVNAGASPALAMARYDKIKNRITISKPIIRGGLLGKYYQSITGSSPNVQINTSTFRGEIVELGHFEEHYIEGGDGDSWDQDSGWLESHDAEFAGGHLIATPGDFGIETFAVIWNGYLEILPSEVGSPITFWVQTDDGTRIFINGQNILPASAWQDHDATFSGTYTFKAPGWHRIRIEYYDNAAGNILRIRWKGASFAAASVIPAERFGYEAPTEAISPSTIPIVYNHAGNYKITSTAQILKGVDVVAQKRFTTTMKIFGTWTQTMKDEFYAAWFNDYAVGVPSGYTNADGNLPPSGGDDYRDGEMRNVTWLDSCPLNATDNLETSGYFSNLDDTTKFKRDSLKLGFWADFDIDPTSTVCNLKALVKSEKWGTDAWINITKDNGAHNFFWISWGDIRNDWTADGGDNELVIDTWWHEGRRFEVNPFYYFPSASDHKTVDGTPDVFMRVWTGVYPEPGVEAKAYWKGDGIEFTQGFDALGNPNGPNVGSIPVVGGVEQIDAPYSGDGTYGWAYDWIDTDPGTNPDIPDNLYQKGERICKVWPAGSHAAGDRKAIYNTSTYDIEEDQTDPYNYWQPDVPFTTPMIYACGERLDSVSGSGMAGARGFGLLEKDNDTYWDVSMKGWTYPEDNDIVELTLDSVTGTSPPYLNRIGWLGLDYDEAPVLAIIGSNGNYIGWLRGKTAMFGAPMNRTAPHSGVPIAATTTVSVPNFQFLSRNCYDANDAWNEWQDWPKWMVPTVEIGVKELYRTGGSADQYPLDPTDNTSTTAYFDNIRIIPASGFLVSTPFRAVSSDPSAPDIQWGTVSWTEDKPANTNVTIYLRPTSTAFPTIDNFMTSYTNGASIGGTFKWIQYKVVLSSTAFSPGAAWGSTGGVTPRLDDITITYIPTVEIYAWKEAP